MVKYIVKIGNKNFDTLNKTYVFGILNCTPDSFSDGGKWNTLDLSLKRAEQMVYEGVDVIDVGGESTRPGYTVISDDEEIERVALVIQKIKENFDIPISLDTYKVKVAEAGIQAGVDLINDIWGLKKQKDMAKLIAESGVSCCLMHNREKAEYSSFIDDVYNDIKKILEIANENGIKKDKICIDPGVGFGKTYEQNLIVINKLELFNKLKYPILLGTSRKSVIGLALDLPVDERLEGTLATTAMAVMKGVSFVRVHDVKENVRVIRMIEAIKNVV